MPVWREQTVRRRLSRLIIDMKPHKAVKVVSIDRRLVLLWTSHYPTTAGPKLFLCPCKCSLAPTCHALVFSRYARSRRPTCRTPWRSSIASERPDLSPSISLVLPYFLAFFSISIGRFSRPRHSTTFRFFSLWSIRASSTACWASLSLSNRR